ncbi:thioredoxin family protein [Myxacorys almedinensis]|uniref:Redoxin family protein n=1 Tax=Myxacorys almedinensis A TaxID=2690445 RepID=A0A8J8CK81_9CYAN|nr:thioredoxin family protein [Myxacorys almedinensis]NDJ19279.1 redoxin family protein [Myxacorys almedinensis A]
MTPNVTPDPVNSTSGARVRNFLIALAAIALTVVFSLSLKTQTTSVSLSAMATASVPLEVALGNGKPSLMEFYADWCTSCQAMAPELKSLKDQYSDRVNFVMLNVDNEKWLPEILSYRVDGIPHFVYVSDDGRSIGQAIGEQPRNIIEDNLIALTTGTALPHAQGTGQTSEFSAPVSQQGNASDPRSHGSQVVDRS